MSIRIIQAGEGLRDADVAALRDRLRAGRLTGGGEAADVPSAVGEILADVRARGDAALIDRQKRLDQVALTPATLRVRPEQIAAAQARADPDFLALIGRAADNVRRYQQSIRLADPPAASRGGRTLGLRYVPVDRVGVYVPGGRAAYPSTVLMTVVPAQVAGVREIAMASPPTTDGDVNPMVLALAGALGVSEVYRLGGAVAIAALAYGTESVPGVDKVVGPGNAFVAEAKRRVLGAVGIDSIAGPSEVLIVADASAPATWVAADLLAQAEHDPGSAVLVTPSADLAEAVAAAIEEQLPALDRAEAIGRALDEYSAIVVVADLPAACDVANGFAPEHLQVIVAEAAEAEVLERIRHAGAIFVGPHTPVPLGDYYAGPSHVLPTGGTARFFGPLSCNDFLVGSSVVRYDASALAADADDVIDFATREGLTAHARAVDIRRRKP